MRRVARRVTVRTVPWCECKRPWGYKQHPEHEEEFFVHSGCMKPSKMYLEKRCA